MNFKVNVWTRGSTTVSHESDDVTATYHVTHFDEILLIVRVTGNDAITVRNFNHFAIAVTLTAPANNPAGHTRSDSTKDYQYMLQLHLKGLGIIGSKSDDILSERILGYDQRQIHDY